MKILEISSKSLLEALLAVADLVFLLDREGKFLDVHSNGTVPLLLPPQEFLGKTLSNVLDADLAQKVYSQLSEALNGQTKKIFEYELTLDGERKFFEATIIPLDMSLALVFVKDITSRKEAEIELEKNKNFLQNIFDGLRDGLSILDKDLNILKVNYWMRKKYAHAEPIEGKKCYQVYQGRNTICPWCPSVKTLATEKPAVSIVPYVTDEGWKGWIELSTFPLKDEKGNLIGVIEDCKDITDRIKIEQNLRRLATVVEQSSEGIVICDTKGQVQYVNPAFEELTGYKQNDLSGKCFFELIKENNSDLFSAVKEFRPWRGQLSLTCKDGKEILIDLSFSLVKDDAGKVRNLVTIIRDVTQKILLEKQLSQAQKMEAIGRLAGGIAHDFNNILTAVIGYSELLMLKLKKDDMARKYAEHIYSSLKRASALTEKLLTFSKKRPYRIDIFDLNENIQDILPLLRRLIREDISINLKLSKETAKIQGDPSAIEQILVNLVLNAAEAIQGKGRIDIEVNVNGSFVSLLVRDNGCGIAKENLEKIFDPFFSTKETGTGLGLYVVYNLVQQFNGKIEVESYPQQGSTFRVLFPRIELSSKEKVSSATQGLFEGSFVPAKVLLVEDEDSVREFIEEVLSARGLEVISAANGREALEKLEPHSGEIDLLITDVVMPEMGGVELWQKLRSRYPQMRVLFISGYPKEQEDLLPEENFLPKPFTSMDLLCRVKDLLPLQN